MSHGQRCGSLSQHAEHVHLPQLGHVKQYPLGLAAGVDVGRLVPAIESLTFFWGRTLTSPATSSLLQAAEAKEASALLQAATAALQKTLHTPTTPASLWSLVRAMNDPAIQRALGLLLTFAQAFGEGLSSSSRALSPSSSSSSSR